MTSISSAEQPRVLSTAETFSLGGAAACIAVTVSNPAEVAKTRLQLQGELAKEGAKKVYKNSLDVIRKTWSNEGIRGLQRGLPPAYLYQILVNGSRLGFYEPLRQRLNHFIGRSADTQLALTSMVAGASSGALGAALGNPLFLVKARMQAYSPALPGSTQHVYKSSLDAFTTIFKNERFQGLVRGIDAAVLRTAIGSSVQIPTYNFTKNWLVTNGVLPGDSLWTYLLSSSASGATMCIVMQPTDTALTRMYNQPTVPGPNGKLIGALYKSPVDCLWKTFKAEGIRGLYKGSTAHFLRIAPHTVIVLTANDIILRLYKKYV